ncbi:MAG: putative Ig domain-containing protein [Blastocatellales bacterium]
MRTPHKINAAYNLITRSSYGLPKLATFGLALALTALALIAQRHFAVTAQESLAAGARGIHLIEIAPDPNGSTGIVHHQPSNSLLLSSSVGVELFGADGARTPFSRIGAHPGALAAVRESKNGFIGGEVFAGGPTPGAILRISPTGSLDQNPWVTLPGETGLVRGLYFDNRISSASSSEAVSGGDLIAATASGGVWRIDSSGNAQRVTAMITALSVGAVEAPISFDAVTLAPNDTAKYGALAGKILALAGQQGLIYAIDAGGGVESFKLGISHTNNLLVIPANENFFGVTADRESSDQREYPVRKRGTIWGSPAADFAGVAGDLLVTQIGGETCQCQPAIWRLRWTGAEFEKMKLAGIPNAPHRTEWRQVTFSPFGGELFNEISQTEQQPNLSLVKSVADLNGGFVQPGDTLEYTLTLSNPSSNPVSKSFIAEFIPANTDYVANSTRITAGANIGAKTDAIDNDQVDAFAVSGRVIQLNIGTGTGAGGHDAGGRLIGGTLAPGESTTAVFRVTVKTDLSEGAPVVNGAEWGANDIYPGGRSNVVANTVGSPLRLEKSVTDLNGGQALPGDTLEYKLTLTNQSFDPVGKSFIAEFIPKGVTYVANSVQITAGANTGAKTDAADADQVDFFPASGANGQINIATGAGAGRPGGSGGLNGGTLAAGESTTAVFRVKVNTGASVETIVSNGADAGANDIYPIATSNVVTTNVGLATPLIGPFGQYAATGPTGNNDDFTLGRVNLTVSNGVTTETGVARFINTVRNVGTVAGKFVISAPTIPPGFKVMASADSGATFFSLNNGGTATTPTEVTPNEERNIDVRIELPAGLAVNTDYDIVIQAAWDVDQSRFNQTIDRVRPDPNPPNLALTKAVRDLSGKDIAGGKTSRGQIIEYTLTLRNQSTVAVGNTFIAEYLPPNVTYVAESTQITAGPNTGPKTDARGDDQVDFFPSGFVNGQLNIFTGTGAAANKGGTLAPGESTTVAFRVMINTTAANGTIIRNGADWGAEDFVIGGKSNVVAVTVACPTITLSPAAGALPAGIIGTAYSQTFTQTGGIAPVAFSVSAGALPPGLTLNASTGALTGTPTQSGSFSFTITATDVGACTGSAAYTLVINPSCTPPAITTQPASLVRTAGQSATFSVTATGTSLTYQWRKGGVNIAGATASSFTIASVKTSDAGSYDVIVSNACGTVTSTAATLTVNCQTITISPVALPVGVVGTAYNQLITQTGGVAPVAFSVSAGALPPGLSLNTTTGALTGTPTQVGQFSFTIKATDANGCAGVQPYLLPITPSATPSCSQTICFRSSAYFSLNFGTSAIPRGTVLIGGVNLNNPVASTDQRVKQALDGQSGAFNREFVAAQLNILAASGLGAANVVTALASELSCYGLQFGLVRLSNGVILTPQSSLSDLISAANFVAKGGGDSKDNCIVTKLLGALNGTSSANVCNRPISPVDLSGCL